MPERFDPSRCRECRLHSDAYPFCSPECAEEAARRYLREEQRRRRDGLTRRPRKPRVDRLEASA